MRFEIRRLNESKRCINFPPVRILQFFSTFLRERLLILLNILRLIVFRQIRNCVTSFHFNETRLNSFLYLQLHFAAHDKERFSCRKGYEPLKDSLAVNYANMEFYEYDAEHDFANPSQPNFLRGACTLSVNRCCEFLKQHLS